MIKGRADLIGSKHYVNYLQEKISVTDIRIFFFSVPLLGTPKVFPNSATLFPFTIIELNN